MGGVTVTAQAEILQASEGVGHLTMSPQQLQTLPGVSAANDGSSGLYVRGAPPIRI